MHKRTLYISSSAQGRIDALAQMHNTTKADILRCAVEAGLDIIEKPPAGNQSASSTQSNTINSSNILKSVDNTVDNLLTHFFKLILR